MNNLTILSSIQWQQNIGDASLFGWLTVLVYLLAGGVCLLCAWHVSHSALGERLWAQQLLWVGLALGLLFLGVNKQLDLQSGFTVQVKAMAYKQGWYALGQRAQILFIILLGTVSLAIIAVVGWQLRHTWRQSWLLLLGMLFLARFVIVRAASFYGVPLPALSQFTNGWRITWLLEILGASAIALSALLTLRSRKFE